MKYPPRTEVLMVRLRPIERQRATTLASAEEVHVPELVRRLLAQAWQEKTRHDDPKEAA
jgi:hypothetical protein